MSTPFDSDPPSASASASPSAVALAGGLPRSTSTGLQAVLSDPNLISTLQDAPHPQADLEQAAARLRFEQAVRRYYYQLTVGCGTPNCATKLCRSHPAAQRLLPDAAAVLAVQLAARPRPLYCPRCPANPDVPLPMLASATIPAGAHFMSAGTTASHSRAGSGSPGPGSSLMSPASSTIPSDSFAAGTGAGAGASSTATSSPGSPAVARAGGRTASRLGVPTNGSSRGRSPSPTPFLHSMLASATFAGIFSPPATAPPVPGLVTGESSAARVEAGLASPPTGSGRLAHSTSQERMRMAAGVTGDPADGSGNKAVQVEDTLGNGLSASRSSLFLADLPGQLLSMTSRLTRSISQQLIGNSSTASDVTTSPPGIVVSGASTTGGDLPPSQSTTSLADTSRSDSTDPPSPPPTAVGRVLKHMTLALWDETVAKLATVQVEDDQGVTEPRETPAAGDGAALGDMLDDDAHAFLIASLRHIFASPHALAHSFRVPAEIGSTFPADYPRALSKGEEHKPAADEDDTEAEVARSRRVHATRVDLAAVRVLYERVLGMQPEAQYRLAIAEALELLLARLSMDPVSTLDTKPKLATLLIVLANPMLADPQHYESLTRPLLVLLTTKLRAKHKSVLVHWLAAYPRRELLPLIDAAHAYLSAHYTPAPKPEAGVVAAVRFLGLLYSANELGGGIVPYSAFYNPRLNADLNFKDEYRTWRRILERSQAQQAAAGEAAAAVAAAARVAAIPMGSGSDGSSPRPAPAKVMIPLGAPMAVDEFSYFNYPFLFDPSAKTRILHIDAMVQMSQEYEDACVSQALVAHTQKMLLADAARSTQLELSLRHVTNPYLVLEVGRQNLVDDVMAQVAGRTHGELKKPLKIKFRNEEGMDQGGVQKEFFQVLLSQLLDPVYGMFTYDDATRYSWVNAASLDSTRQFELVGTIFGLAVYNGVIVDVRFPKLLYKRLLGEQPALVDVKETWPDLGRGLQQLLDWDEAEGDVEDVFCRSFEISVEVFGQVRTVELVKGGSERPVTNLNRQEYVDLYVDYVTKKGIDRQFRALRRGFLHVCGGYALSMCRPEELELLMCGVECDMDLHPLEKACGYDDGYHPAHQTIRDFWAIVHALGIPQKKRLLEFVTASDRVPLKGLASLTFVIQRNGPDSDRLPTALTCFGRLLLPEYAGKDKLKFHLLTAIENAKGFGLV